MAGPLETPFAAGPSALAPGAGADAQIPEDFHAFQFSGPAAPAAQAAAPAQVPASPGVPDDFQSFVPDDFAGFDPNQGQKVYDSPVGPPKPFNQPGQVTTATHMSLHPPQLVENVDGTLAVVDGGKIRPLSEAEKHAAHLMAQAIRIGGPVIGGSVGSLAGPLGSGAGSVAGGEAANPTAQQYDKMAGEKPHERNMKERAVEGVLGTLAPFAGKFMSAGGLAADSAIQSGAKVVTGGAEAAGVNTVAELEAKGAQASEAEKAAGDQALKDANLPVIEPGEPVSPKLKKGVEQQTIDALERAKKNQAKAPEVAEAVKKLDQEHQHYIGSRTRVAIRREQGQLHPVSDELAADYEKYMGTPASEAGAAQAGEPQGDTAYPKKQVQQGAEASAKNPGKPGSRANIPDQEFTTKHVQQGFEVGAKGRVPVKGASEPQVQVQEGLPGIAGRTKYRTGSSEQLPENLSTRGQVSSTEQASPAKQVQQSAPLVVGKEAPSPGSVGQFESATPSSEVQPALPLEGGGAQSKRLSLQQIEALRNKIRSGYDTVSTPEERAVLDAAYARAMGVRDELIAKNLGEGVAYPGKREFPPMADSAMAKTLRAKRDALHRLKLNDIQGITETLEKPGATMLDVAKKHPFEQVKNILTPEQLTSVGDSMLDEIQQGVKGSPSKALQQLIKDSGVIKPYLGEDYDKVVTALRGAAEIEARAGKAAPSVGEAFTGALQGLSKYKRFAKWLGAATAVGGAGMGYKAWGSEPNRSPQSDGTKTTVDEATGTVGGAPVKVPVTTKTDSPTGKDTRDPVERDNEKALLRDFFKGEPLNSGDFYVLREAFNYRLRHGLPVQMYNKRLVQKLKEAR